jgi:hypothetical protein
MPRRARTINRILASAQLDPRLGNLGELSGAVGSQSAEQLQLAKALKVFRDYIHRPFDTTMQKYGVNEAMKRDKDIQWSYISRRLSSQPLFTKDRIGATFAVKWIVQLLIADGIIKELSSNQISSRYQYTGKAYFLSDLKQIG